MILKKDLNNKAITLRKNGLTYSQILRKIPVAKSTLAMWFKDVNLSKPQIQRITKNRIEAGLRGGIARRKQRIEKSKKIWQIAEKEVGKISKRELWLIGITLYWAEGSKEKDWRPGSRVSFTNMDKNMIKVFIKWLKLCKIKKDDLSFDLFIHENHKRRIIEIKKYWSKVTGFPISKFNNIYFKKNKINTKRVNIDSNYFGVIKIIVLHSSSFLRQITGWTNGIYKGINI